MRGAFLPHLLITLVITTVSTAEFQINTRTSNNQANPAIAQDANGNFVIIWSSYFGSGRSNDILGQRFDPNGTPIGNEFQINTITPGNQTESSIAMNAVGNFVVAWQGPGVDEEDIFLQRFDPNGQTIGDETLVNTYTQGQQLYPKVAIDNSGAFAVVWENEKLESKITVISCQLFDANGLAVSEEFNINATVNCRYPDVAMDLNGNFVIVWMEDKSSNSIMAQLYNADGTAKTEPFQVNTVENNFLTEPAIAMNANGYFVVTWDGDHVKAGLDDIHARLFDPNGMPLGEQFIVNTSRAEAQQNPQVAMNNKGEFVIVWESKIESSTIERDIFGQQFNSSGQPVGDEFLINTYVEGDQRNSDVAIRENGEFVTVWQSDDQDGSGWGIFGEINSMADFIEVTSDDATETQEHSQ
ncbi:MAG: hypothetical protein A2167_04030 [Planctomycetes bacterium RBG_13_46_10]|nr:MAG: hypothetical protein A2167_04030 [Planctomycetes bacterium RBG_13_46_10]